MRNENVKLSSQLFFTLINCKRINENLKIKRTFRRLLLIEEKFVFENNDNVVVNDFNAITIINDDDDDSFANNKRDVNEIAKNVNEDEIARHKTNDDENSFRDIFRDRDFAFDKHKRI